MRNSSTRMLVALAAGIGCVLGAGLWVGGNSLPDVSPSMQPSKGVDATPREAPVVLDAEPDTQRQMVPLEQQVEEPVPEAASPKPAPLPANDPVALLELARGLLNREDFINQVVESQVLVEMPSTVTANAAVADKVYWSLVHVLAGQMYTYRPDALARDPTLAEQGEPDRIRTELLRAMMPDLPKLLRDKAVEMTVVAKGGKEREYGNLRGQSVFMQIDEKYERMRLTLERGPWSIKLIIPQRAVQPDLWSTWVAAQKRQFYQK